MKAYILMITLMNVVFCFSQGKIFPPIVRPVVSYRMLVVLHEGKEYYSYNNLNSKYLNGKYEIENYFLDKILPDSVIIDKELENGRRCNLAYRKYRSLDMTEEGSFFKGYKHGFWKTMYKNKLVKTANYNNGLAVGRYRVYNVRGDLLYKTTFGSKGNGNYKDYYYKTGSLKEEGAYKNGKKEGEWRSYNEQGALIGIKYYSNGQMLEK